MLTNLINVAVSRAKRHHELGSRGQTGARIPRARESVFIDHLQLRPGLG